MATTCDRFTTVSDGAEVLMQCNNCRERHYFTSDYFARQWANHHAYAAAGHTLHAKRYCICVA